MSSSTTSGGIAMAPSAARGCGMSGTGITGAPQPAASLPSSPPWVTATILAPCIAASVAASSVSSVLPEHEMANTSEPSPTKAGSS